MVSGFEHLIPDCTNQEKDRHVLAAAIHVESQFIVTFNCRDISPSDLDRLGVSAVCPSDLLSFLFEYDPETVSACLTSMAEKASRTYPQILSRIGWYAPEFDSLVAQRTGIELPIVSPKDWRRKN
jgi:hypothetical protein